MDMSTALPSSPPLCAEMPDTADFLLLETQHDALSPKSSSPPPLFSSDDSRGSIDVSNYESPRILKNKRKGTWWTSHDAGRGSPRPKKSRFSRNFDSGVYMMSDVSDSSEELLPQHFSPFPVDGPDKEQQEALTETRNAFNVQFGAGMERNAENYVFREMNLEDDDIRDVGDLASVIKNLPDPGQGLPVEGQYRSMVPELFVDFANNKLTRLVPSLFDVQSLTTLILRNNNIRELPPQICQLVNLKILDISLNKLDCLPFELLQILKPHGQLERFTSLGNPFTKSSPNASISGGDFPLAHPPPPTEIGSCNPNLFQHLFMAKSVLPKLRKQFASQHLQRQLIWQIRHHESWANAFVADIDATLKGEEEIPEDEGVFGHHPSLRAEEVVCLTPRYIARTFVSFYEQSGALSKGSPELPAQPDETFPIIITIQSGTYCTSSPTSWFTPRTSTRVAPLITTSLHNAFEKRHIGEYTLQDIRDMLPNPVPYVATAIFDKAIENDAGGYGEFRNCHVCHRKYVVPRAGWLEFWSIGRGELYPFKLKVCSWGCVPTEMTIKPEKELE